MANNLCKKFVLLFILLSIFFLPSLHGSPSLDPNASERNSTMKLARSLRGGSGGHARGGHARGGHGQLRKSPFGRVIPLHGGGSHRNPKNAATRISYSLFALVLVVAAAGTFILSSFHQ